MSISTVDNIILSHGNWKHTFNWPDGKGPTLEKDGDGLVISLRDEAFDSEFASTVRRLSLNDAAPHK